MVGSGLKKYAQELGFKLKNGVAYGVYEKYTVTMKEGSGWKCVTFSVTFPTENEKAAMQAMLLDTAFQKKNRIMKVDITDAMVMIKFIDNYGTMNTLKNVTELVCARLKELGIMGVECCNACRCSFEGVGGEDVLIDGNVFYMHSGCIDSLDIAMTQNAEEIKNSGSIGRGILGAALGAVIGAIPWAIAYYAGWFVAFLGFLVGIASKKGYELLGGKETKAKGISIIVSTLLAVVAVEFAVVLAIWYGELSGYGISFMQSVEFFLTALGEDSEMIGYIIRDILLGWLFAGLGIFSTIKNIFSDTKSAVSTPVRLDRE